MRTALTLLLFSLVFVLNTLAQDFPYTTIEGGGEGHTEFVYSVAFSPDGQILASRSGDKTIRLWDVSTGRHLHTLTGHTGSISFSPDSNLLASGGSDKTIRLWDVGTGTHLRTLIGHTEFVTSVAFSPDGQILASSSGDKTIRLWDVSTGRHLRTLEGHTGRVGSVAFNPNGTILASGSWDRTIRLWDLSTGKNKLTLPHDSDFRRLNSVRSVVFSPDGQTLASGSGSGEIYLFDLAPAIIHWNSFDEITIRGQILTGHTHRVNSNSSDVNSVSFSPDGQTLASGGEDATIRLWDVSNLWGGGTDSHLRTLTGHKYRVNSVAFSPDGQMLASGGGPYPDDGSSRYGLVRLWDVNTGTLLRTHAGSALSFRNMLFSPDGKTLVTSADRFDDEEIRVWDVESGSHLRTLSISGPPWFWDEKTLATRSGTSIALWDAETGKHLRTLTVDTSGGWRQSLTLSSDGQMLALASSDGTVHLWDINTGARLQTLIGGHTNQYQSLLFSPDGSLLASRRSRTIYLWDVNTGARLQTLTLTMRGELSSMAFSPDGQMLASGGDQGDYRWGRIHLWEVGTGRYLRTLQGGNDVRGVSFSPDGQVLASRHFSSGYVRLWNVETGRHLRTLGRDTDDVGLEVRSVAFSPDGGVLASLSYDKILLYKLPSTRVSITPNPVVSPAIGEQLTVNVSIVAGEDVGGYQVSLEFDADVLRYVEGANGDYLPPGAFFVPPVVSESEHRSVNKKIVTLGATSLTGSSNGDGKLATVTFEVLDVKESIIDLLDVILTDNSGEHLLHFAPHGTTVDASVLPSSAIVSLDPTSVLSPATGEQFTFNIDIAGGQNVSDYQLTYDFDESALLKYISRNRGNYLAHGVGNGDGTLETVTFEVLDVKASSVNISGYLVAPNGLRYLPTFESAKIVVPILGDVNRDGVVNILDLVLVASSFAQPVPEEGNPADVNEDGIVNIVDLVIVAGELGGEAAAPSAWSLDLEDMFTREQVQQWLSEARQFNLTDATVQRGILYLEQLLAALTPKETVLLPNYPNPFNPETWIPYQLSKPAEVTLTIYAVDGTVVRTLALGHRPIGIYQGKSRAAYWDGRNEAGEPVASGVYFYTLTAGDFTATRKMLIRK